MLENLVSIIFVLVSLVLLGSFIAFSPILIITQIAILTKSTKPLLHSLALLSGIATPLAFVVIMAALFIDPDRQVNLGTADITITIAPILYVLFGLVLCFVGYRMLTRPPRTDSLIDFDDDKGMSLGAKVYWFSFFKMGTKISSFAAIIFAAQLIKTNFDSAIMQFIFYVWLFMIAMLPFVWLIALHQSGSKLFDRINDYMNRLGELPIKKYTAIFLICAGLFFVIYGLLR